MFKSIKAMYNSTEVKMFASELNKFLEVSFYTLSHSSRLSSYCHEKTGHFHTKINPL